MIFADEPNSEASEAVSCSWALALDPVKPRFPVDCYSHSQATSWHSNCSCSTTATYARNYAHPLICGSRQTRMSTFFSLYANSHSPPTILFAGNRQTSNWYCHHVHFCPCWTRDCESSSRVPAGQTSFVHWGPFDCYCQCRSRDFADCSCARGCSPEVCFYFDSWRKKSLK